MKKHKTALIFGGGGCAIAYSTGILFRLIEQYGMSKPDMIFSGSAGSSLAAFYITDKLQQREKTGIPLFSSKRFVNPLRFRKIMDLDHLIYHIYPQKYGITTELLQKKSEKTDRYLGMTNTKSGQAVTFESKQRPTTELIRASMSIGIAYGKKVMIKGKRYIDGPFSASAEFLIDQACKKGADKIIVITPRGYSSPYRKADDRLTNLRLLSKPKKCRRQIKKDRKTKKQLFKKYKLPKEGIATCYDDRILYISPITKEFNHELTQNDIITLSTSILHGKVDMTTNPVIEEFVQNM